MSSRSSPVVSLSKSLQQVTNRAAVGVLQGQRLANSQYHRNSKLAFSFPEETDSRGSWGQSCLLIFVQINSFLLSIQRLYRDIVARIHIIHGILKEKSTGFGFAMSTHAHMKPDNPYIAHKRHPFCIFLFILSFKRLQRGHHAANQWE